ncbi:MAG: DUF99 family protein [Nannocystaceae bacterium]
MRRLSNVIGIDDAPFVRSHRGDVPIIGVVTTRARVDGIVRSRVRRDGVNSTTRIAELVTEFKFAEHLQAVILQGIALAGFNVVDIHGLHAALQRPVLVVARRKPRLAAIKRALLDHVPGGARKWKLIQHAGPMEQVENVWVQRAGLNLDEAGQLIRTTRVHGALPEPLRMAHLIAGAYADGCSRGRA